MLHKFKEYDNRSYGNGDKVKVLESFFNEFPPEYRLPTYRQQAKFINTNLNSCFDKIIISEEVGFSKPDKRLFELALNILNVQPEDTHLIHRR